MNHTNGHPRPRYTNEGFKKLFSFIIQAIAILILLMITSLLVIAWWRLVLYMLGYC